MKNILFLSNRDSLGGASEWFLNLALALKNAGYSVEFLVKNKYSTYDFVKQIPLKKKEKKSFFFRLFKFAKNCIFKKESVDIFRTTKPEYAFFPKELESDSVITTEEIIKNINKIPNLIISGLIFDFVSLSVVSDLSRYYNIPAYTTAFDANVFTGGCHVMWDCLQYKTDCSNCPGSLSSANLKIIQQNLINRKKYLEKSSIGLLYASPWSYVKANESSLYKSRQKVDVGMCIDTSFYNNKHRIIAKNIFDIESSKKVIFVGADNLKDKRKGMHLFVESLTYMLSIVPKKLHKDILIVIAGRNLNEIDENIIPVNIKKIDFIKDKRLLSLLYQASDLFVCPSIEDAGPMMTAEALSSGTPVVGFKTGLLYDDSLLTNGIQGYSVEMFDVKSLGCAIANILMLNDAEFNEMSLNARKLAINKLSKEVFVDRISKLC